MFLFHSYKIEPDGILIDNQPSKKIKWSDILSMSTSGNVGGFFYEVLTPKGSRLVDVDPSYSRKDFEELIQKNAKLEIAVSAYPTLYKRWKKIDQPYLYTGLFDKWSDAFYGINSKYATIFKVVALGGFLLFCIFTIFLLLTK